MTNALENAFERWKPLLYGVEYHMAQGGSREYLRKPPAMDDFVFGIGCLIREELGKGSEVTAISRQVRGLLKRAAEARAFSKEAGEEMIQISKDAEKLLLLAKNAEGLVLKLKKEVCRRRQAKIKGAAPCKLFKSARRIACFWTGARIR